MRAPSFVVYYIQNALNVVPRVPPVSSLEFGVFKGVRGERNALWGLLQCGVWSLEFGVAQPRRGGQTTGRRWSAAEPLLIVGTLHKP